MWKLRWDILKLTDPVNKCLLLNTVYLIKKQALDAFWEEWAALGDEIAKQ